MRSFLKRYLTVSEQKAFILVLVLILLATILSSQTDKIVNDDLPEDSLKVALQRSNLPNLDIHKATFEQWVMVPGLGTKRALALIEFRDFYGFSVVNDLMKVKGIGINTVNDIIAYGYGMSYNDDNVTTNTQVDATDNLYDLNKASFEQLVSIKGIGKFRAQCIIEMRERVKRFKSFDELLDINGIGPKTVKILESSTYLGQE
ncbi:MAG: helix-hairpin-helix domain-containing protein [Candidatus Zophobacter franzmannii]|nr:helix-hairpin-helix domain-containing protein [Candidatus Zophobacter franzmannii]